MPHNLMALLVLASLISCDHGDGGPEIPIADRTDGAVQLSMTLDGSLQNPAWAPDGQRLVFTRFLDGYNQEPAEVMVFDLGGDKVRTLVADGSGNVNLPGSAWNGPTGTVVFSSTREPHDEIFLIDENGTPGDEIKVTERDDLVAYEPSLSPDGTRVVFESHVLDVEKHGVITVFSVDGSGPYEPLTGADDDCRQPNWSPAGDLILYQRQEAGRWDLWVIMPDGDGKRKITSGPESYTDASFSPSGEWVICSRESETEEHANLFLVPVDGGTPVRLTSYGGYDGAPSWSPDGSQVAFESSAGDPEDHGGTTLWVIDVPDGPWL